MLTRSACLLERYARLAVEHIVLADLQENHPNHHTLPLTVVGEMRYVRLRILSLFREKGAVPKGFHGLVLYGGLAMPSPPPLKWRRQRYPSLTTLGKEL